jgi:thiol-disulfide isomerase/thioredoxin
LNGRALLFGNLPLFLTNRNRQFEMVDHLIQNANSLHSKVANALVGLVACFTMANASDSVSKTSWWNQSYVDIDGKKRTHISPSIKAVVWFFILEDCPISNAYSPEINRLVAAYQPKGVSFVLVHSNPNIRSDDAKKHREDYLLKSPVVLDQDHEWVKYAGAQVTPEAVMLDPEGKLLYRGRIDDRFPALGKRRTQPKRTELRDALDSFLRNQPILISRTKAIGCYIPELPTTP